MNANQEPQLKLRGLVVKRKRLQKIEDVENPVVGKFYLVPCVLLAPAGRRRGLFMPVIGSWHEDTDIGVARHHFHHDVRFFPQSWLWYQDDLERNLIRICSPVGFEGPTHAPPVVYKRRKMRREMPEFPAINAAMGKKSDLAMTLEKQFKDIRMKCMTCPHRGMSLKGLPVKEDGTVVCNGHGLKWNTKTGEMVVR